MDRRLPPTVIAGDEPLLGSVLTMASLTRNELGEKIGQAEGARDDVTRALEVVLSGV